MQKFLSTTGLILISAVLVFAQQDRGTVDNGGSARPDYSGMYSFLRDGEFVQITVEDADRVTGFISRYGDLESDKDAFLDHFFKEGKLNGDHLVFSTETVHGVWFDFMGTVKRGPGKERGEEAYYVLSGTLTEHSTDAGKNTSSKSREVLLKSFPQDMAPAPQQKD